MALYSVCGTNCETCRFFIDALCEGCSVQNTNLETKCQIWICAMDKGLTSCKECSLFPCETYSLGKKKSLALQVGKAKDINKYLRFRGIPIILGAYLAIAGFLLVLQGTSQTLIGIPLIIVGAILVIKHKKTLEIISELSSYI